MSNDIEVIVFSIDHEEEWDAFLEKKACNGTFLQSRHFLNYHPNSKYIDTSLMFYLKNQLVAICPACIKQEGKTKIFYSHAGSTYGGIVVAREILRTEIMLALLEAFETFLCNNGFDKCILKQNNPLMDVCTMDLMNFCLYFKGYHEYKELDLYIDCKDYNWDDVPANFSKLKKRQLKKCLNSEMTFKRLNGRKDMEEFIRVLAENLKKYDLVPYHTADDLLDLQRRFPDEIEYWGAIYDNHIVAETMLFLFKQSKCVHTHYLASDPEYKDYNPMTFIYYSVIERFKNEHVDSISWGITTEHLGVEINRNLTNNKEEFGSKHNVVSIWEKEL